MVVKCSRYRWGDYDFREAFSSTEKPGIVTSLLMRGMATGLLNGSPRRVILGSD